MSAQDDLKCVLVATDFSTQARHAAERAALLAKEHGATLHLLHVADELPLENLKRLVGQDVTSLARSMIDRAEGELLDIARAIEQEYGVSAEALVARGSVLAEIEGCADTLACDLVVLGATGARFGRQLVLGSTAERMLSVSSRPILIAKGTSGAPYRRVLVPVDFSQASARLLSLALSVAPRAEIVLLHVSDATIDRQLRLAGAQDTTIDQYRTAAREEVAERLKEMAASAGANAHVQTSAIDGDPWPSILEQEQAGHYDLIVMGKHGTSQLKEWLLGSVTRRVLNQSQSDVLVSV